MRSASVVPGTFSVASAQPSALFETSRILGTRMPVSWMRARLSASLKTSLSGLETLNTLTMRSPQS